MKKLTTADLAPHPRNPRKISSEQLIALRKSLETFGSLDGIILNQRTGRLVGGHQRIKALCDANRDVVITKQFKTPSKWGTVGLGVIYLDGKQEEGLPCRIVDWDETKEKAAMIAANKHGGDWALDELTNLLMELDADNYPLDVVGFSKQDLKLLFTSGEDKESSGEGAGSGEAKLHRCPECGHQFTSAEEKE